MAPESGAINPKYERVEDSRAIRSQARAAPKAVCLPGLEAEAGKIAVADREARAAAQEAVDGGHEAGKQRARGSNGDGGSLGHCCPLSRSAAGGRVVIWEQSMYTRCQQQRICLHSSILHIASQYQRQ